MTDYTISQSADDCAESETNSVVTNGSTIVIDGRGKWGGFRFQNISIPQGATIDSATFYMRHTGDSTQEQITIELYGVDTDDFSSAWGSSNKPSNQTLTTNYDTNTFNSAFTPNSLYDTREYDIKDIVQEIVNRGGWSSGNDMGFVAKRLFDVDRGTDVRIRAYDGGSSSACYISITYSSGTNTQINISDSWKDIDAMQINIGDAWKEVAGMQINIGDAWKEVF
jgi:hypothetical protein